MTGKSWSSRSTNAGNQDDNSIAPAARQTAWFKDSEGNILAVSGFILDGFLEPIACPWAWSAAYAGRGTRRRRGWSSLRVAREKRPLRQPLRSRGCWAILRRASCVRRG